MSLRLPIVSIQVCYEIEKTTHMEHTTKHLIKTPSFVKRRVLAIPYGCLIMNHLIQMSDSRLVPYLLSCWREAPSSFSRF